MSNPSPATYFIDGGTLRADTPSYVKRPADDELFNALLNREYCYILTPRQMGKSSLMIHTSQRLKEQNIQTAVVDIQGIGTNNVREWYASLLSRLRRGLRLSVDVDEWMAKKSSIGYGQMFSDFIQDVVLTEITDPVVIFLDEVDWMIKIDFRDDFFANIRWMYNARAEYPDFNRISFVLLGVASPADLISEPTRTPFNIGHPIALQELSLEDALPLQNGLEQVCPGQGERILDRIFHWTSGHPYLTQKVCRTIADANRTEWSNLEVDELVHSLFLAEESRKEANLKFIQDRILSNQQFADLLKLYKRVRRGRVKESGQSIVQNQLILSGLLTSKDGYLEVRNQIYRTVFNERWINRYMPKNWQKIALVALGSMVSVLLVILAFDSWVGMNLGQHSREFYGSTAPEQLARLAQIYRLRGVLSNTNTRLSAAQLFYGLQREGQLAIFSSYARESDPQWQADLVTVVSNLYVTVAYVDPNNDNTELLQTMRDSLGKVQSNAEVDELMQEISAWLAGRQNYRNGDFDAALAGYNNAIALNQQNPATFYERALVYIGRADKGSSDDYINALQDLDTTISLAQQLTGQDEIEGTPIPTFTSTDTPTETNTPTETPSPTDTSLPTSTNTFQPDLSNTGVPFETPSATLSATSQPQAGNTAVATLTPSPTPSPTFTPTPVIAKFESKFTNFSDIYSAVSIKIFESVGLRVAMADGETAYPNLDAFGLISSYAIAPILVTNTPTRAPEVSSAVSEATSAILSIAFSPDGQTLAVGSRNNTILLWDLNSNQFMGEPLRGHTGSVNSVAFSPDGRTLASGSSDNTVILWDRVTLQPIVQPLSVHSDIVTSVAFSPAGLFLASAGYDGNIIFWEINTGRQLGQTLSSGINEVITISNKFDRMHGFGVPAPGEELPSNSITSIAFSPDGRILAAGMADSAIVIWDVSDPVVPVQISTLAGHSGSIYSVAFSPDGNTLASGGADNRVILWDVSNPADPAQIGNPQAASSAITSIAFSPDGSTLVYGSANGAILHLDLQARTRIAQFEDTQAVSSIAFSPDGNLIASGGLEGIVVLVNAQTGQLILRLTTDSTQSSTDLAWGMDVSSFQQDYNIDWQLLKDSGMDFVYIRATSGDSFIDPAFQAHWDAAGQAGLARGAYHYFVAEDDLDIQAKEFSSIVSIDESELPLVVVVDNTLNESVEDGFYLESLRVFLENVELSTGSKPMIYARSALIEGRFAAAEDFGLTTFPLWLAQYPTEFDATTMPNENMPSLPEGWQSDWVFWQYTDSGNLPEVTDENGDLANVDLNVFNGTDAEFQQYLRSVAGDSVTPTPSEWENLLAYYTLNETNTDSKGNYSPIDIGTGVFSGDSVFCDGVEYSCIHTPSILDLDYQNFSISAEFKVNEYPRGVRPVFVGGELFRWIGFNLYSNGHVGLLYNNQELVECSGEYSLDTWHNALVTYDGREGRLYLDGNLICSATFMIDMRGEDTFKDISSSNYSNATAFKGFIRNLGIYRTAITP